MTSARAVPIRAALLALTVISILATAFELAAERHWIGVVQLIPWAALVVLVPATALAATGRATTVVRVLAVVVLAVSGVGILEHVLANLDAGPLDARYGPGWDALPVLTRWWYAVTKTVGPSPTLAPGVLAQTSLLLLLASAVPRRAGAAHRRLAV